MREVDGEVLEKYQKFEKEQIALKQRISSINNEVSTLCKRRYYRCVLLHAHEHTRSMPVCSQPW